MSFEGKMKGIEPLIGKRLESLLQTAVLLHESMKLDSNVKKVRDLIGGMKDKFIILVLGEFSSGKSSFINALLKEGLLTTSILPETVAITFVTYGDEKKLQVIYKGRGKYELTDDNDMELIKRDAKEIERVELYCPLLLLKRATIVDTPGLNTIFRDHELTTKEFLHRADTIIWILDATKAGKSKEKEYLDYAREHAGKMIGVVNKIDLVEKDELEELREFVDGHFQGIFNKIFYVSSIKLNGIKEKTGIGFEHNEYYGLRDLEEFLYNDIMPAKEMVKYKATLGSLIQIMRETNEILVKGEQDLIDNKSMIKEVTEGLRGIEGLVRDSFEGIISDGIRGFAQNSKERTTTFLKEEIDMGKALKHLFKPPDITEDFRKTVLNEKVLKDLLSEIGSKIENVLIKGWKGRIEKVDIMNCGQLSISFPPLGSELDVIVSRVYSQVVEKAFPFIFPGIVTMLIWLLCTLNVAALLPLILIIIGYILGQWYCVLRRKKVVKDFSRFVDQYCELLKEKVMDAAKSLNRRVFFKAQDNVISEILGYKLSYGEVENRLTAIRKGSKELQALFDESLKLEKELLG